MPENLWPLSDPFENADENQKANNQKWFYESAPWSKPDESHLEAADAIEKENKQAEAKKIEAKKKEEKQIAELKRKAWI